MSANIKSVTDNSFEEDVLKASLHQPVLIDFWAEWCGPCKMIAPILDEISQEYGSKVVIGKVNVDENSQTPAKYGIRGIPSLLLFKDGEIAGMKVGAMTKSQLAAFLDDHL